MARPASEHVPDRPAARERTGRLTAAEAARRLGVKRETLYAYVSRGLLTSYRAAGGRASLFDPVEVGRLALRGRRRAPRASAPLVIDSGLTAIQDGSFYYRGLDAVALARTRTFEQVAVWLWTGSFADHATWAAEDGAVAVGAAAQAALPAGTPPLERLRVLVAALAATDELRFQLDPAAVVATGRSLLAGLVDALPPVDPGARPAGRTAVAGRLWPALCPAAPSPAMLGILDAALVLLADHELAASTLAARVAASVRADPYAVVLAGLGAVSGALHGGASLGAEALLDEVGRPDRAARVIGDRLRRGEQIPGLGHPLYPDGDPRARALLQRLQAAAAGAARLAVVEAVLDAVGRRDLGRPNVDFALAALGHVTGMVRGAGEAIFATARIAGWLAHALEQYEHAAPFRLRALYTGPPVTPAPGRGHDRGHAELGPTR